MTAAASPEREMATLLACSLPALYLRGYAVRARAVRAFVLLLFISITAHSAVAQEMSNVRDTVRGVVFDSLTERTLSGALIVASPGGAMATSDSLGRYTLISEEIVQQLTAYHSELDLMGLGVIGAARPEGQQRWLNATLATPALTTLWPRVCDSRRPEFRHSGIITGTARLADNSTRVSGAKVIVQWTSVFDGQRRLRSFETITDSLGDFVICGVEEFAEPSLAALSSEAQSGVLSMPSQASPLRRVDLVLAALDAVRATVRGRIVDQQGAPVGDVRVSIDGVEVETVSRGDGSFTLTDVPAGSRMLSLRAVGYTPVAQAVEVLDGANNLLTIRIDRAIELEGLRITERVDVRRVRTDFEDRRRAGWGRFIDSTDIAKAPFVRFALQSIQGLTVLPLGNRPTTEFDIRGRGGCKAHIYVDGVQSDIDEANRIPPANLAAVESYASVAFAPAQLVRVRADNCAVVAFWTKTGLRP